MGLELSQEERQELDAYDRARGGRPFARMLGIWEDIAGHINEREWNVDDYTGVLFLWRESLETAVLGARLPLRARLREQVERVDDVFRANTEHDRAGIVAKFFRVGDGWWWRRIPRSGPLRDYLDAAQARTLKR